MTEENIIKQSPTKADSQIIIERERLLLHREHLLLSSNKTVHDFIIIAVHVR